MALTLYYVISKGSKPVGENGFTSNPANIKRFTSVQEAYDWLSEQADAPTAIYTIGTFIEKTAEEL
jgi:hypothetical protein